MKLSDIQNGPDWIIWVVFGIFAIISIVLISGHGSGLIAGYNTSSEAEKGKYDEKKLCKTVGIFMAVISVMILVMALLDDVLPAYVAYVFAGVVIVGAAVMIILGNTVCRK